MLQFDEFFQWNSKKKFQSTCLSPRCVRAEHSRYLTARILFASFWPCSRLMGAWPFSARICKVSLSSRRSILVPVECTNIFSIPFKVKMYLLPISKIGASAQWCLISGHHLDVTFSKEDGETTEKQIRKTSVWKKIQVAFLGSQDTLFNVQKWEKRVLL